MGECPVLGLATLFGSTFVEAHPTRARALGVRKSSPLLLKRHKNEKTLTLKFLVLGKKMQECPILRLATLEFGHVFIEIRPNQGVCPRREWENLPLIIKESKKRENVNDRLRESWFESLRQAPVSVVIRLVNTVCSA